MTSPTSTDPKILPPTEVRPWGQFTVLADLPNCKVKQIVIQPGQRLSLQRHQQRTEHWTVIQGPLTVTVGENTWEAVAGEHILIPCGAKHRAGNQGKEPATFIEVQTGAYFGEDDIERFADDYDRA